MPIQIYLSKIYLYSIVIILKVKWQYNKNWDAITESAQRSLNVSVMTVCCEIWLKSHFKANEEIGA